MSNLSDSFNFSIPFLNGGADVPSSSSTASTEASNNAANDGKTTDPLDDGIGFRHAMELFIIIMYTWPLVYMLLFASVQTQLALSFWWNRRWYEKENKTKAKEISAKEDYVWPTVTIQLPVYNEMYVVERLLDAVVKLDYDKTKVEIQVLDDSNDETVQIIADKIEELKPYGWNIDHVRRADRVGFKAGALAYGLTVSKGEFVAIFDADFIPHADFLRKTVPFFNENANVGVVQTRWEHMNKNYSFLTQMQALALDGHFVVEQMSRCISGHFMHFNGTAGLWRRTCIEDAGGWSSDTLTEDLDLSFRAQLKGWKFKYLGDITTPAELPVAMNAMRTQQFRWMKGPAQCAVKNLPRVLRSPDMSYRQKINAITHLLNSGIYICIFTLTMFSAPLVWVQVEHYEEDKRGHHDDLFFNHLLPWANYINIAFAVFFFWLSYEHTRGGCTLRNFLVMLVKFPVFICFYLGMTLHNALAAIEGYRGKQSPFVRTVKFGDLSKKKADGTKKNEKAEKEENKSEEDTKISIDAVPKTTSTKNLIKKNDYVKKEIGRIPPLTFIEAFISLLFLAVIIVSVYFEAYGMLPFHIMVCTGYGIISGYTFLHTYNPKCCLGRGNRDTIRTTVVTNNGESVDEEQIYEDAICAKKKSYTNPLLEKDMNNVEKVVKLEYGSISSKSFDSISNEAKGVTALNNQDSSNSTIETQKGGFGGIVYDGDVI